MDLELQKFDILTTQDLPHQHADRLLVENGKLVLVTALLSHVDLLGHACARPPSVDEVCSWDSSSRFGKYT